MSIWPERLRLRDTGLHDDLSGVRIYTTAGRGYNKREYLRADLVAEEIDQLRARTKRLRFQRDELGQQLTEKCDELKDADHTIEKLKEHLHNTDNRRGERPGIDPDGFIWGCKHNVPLERDCPYCGVTT